MNILQLYQDFSVVHLTSGHKHCRPGWVNTPCPYCTGNPGYHLGFHLTANYYYCWRCGWHPIAQTIAKLTRLQIAEAYTLIRQYGLRLHKTLTADVEAAQPPKKEHILPTGVGPLTKKHRAYLIGRGFDPDYLINTWNIVGTGPISKLDNVDYKHRIIAPIIWNDQEVSFQARDVTGKDPNRYRACPKAREAIHHKHVLYGKQEYWHGIGICCEGITDVWRLGVHAFCTFGIEYTTTQMLLMAKLFKRIAIVFDDDPQAQVQARKLRAELRLRAVDAFIVKIEGDPGAMDQQEATRFVNAII